VATNRFYGSLITPAKRDKAEFFGIPGAKLSTLGIAAFLSENGLGVDFDFGENYAAASKMWACYKATAACVIEKMVLHMNVSDFAGSAPVDETLWLGGAAALGNGLQWGVSSVTTSTSPNLFASGAVTSIKLFLTNWGAEIYRSLYNTDGTTADNSDDVIIVLNFSDVYGLPIRLEKNQSIGVYLNDDISALSSFTGKVFGRLIY
jgi:hypothetical protein